MPITLNLAEGHVPPINLSGLDGFIGQESVTKKISFLAKSSSLEAPFPTLLLTGSHGLGKTYLAEKICNSLGREFIDSNSGMLKEKEDFISEVLSKISGPTTIFLDESHTLSKEITTLLLTLLNPTSSHQNSFERFGNTFIYDMRYINVIFATTDAYMMFKPLKNRCLPIYFSHYSNEDLVSILKYYLEGVKFTCNMNEIADACRSRARDAFLLSQNIKRFLLFKETDVISSEGWEEMKDIFDIFPKGLKREELTLLEAIRDYGPISSGNLARRLMVNEKNIKLEMEIRLSELGLIRSTTKGREITTAGSQYFNTLS
jgi:Holliday junction resolvasome RuvABC ATP-dependent DNA helicase subunit